MIKYFWIILIIAVFIRLIISPVTYHSDIQPFDLAGYVLQKGNILNFYDYLPNLPKNDPVLSVYPSNLFNYPPAVYFFLGFCSIITTFFMNTSFHYDFLFNFKDTIGNPFLFIQLTLLKLPYFIFDLLGAYFFSKLFEKDREKTLAFSLWLFNPVNLYATYMIGQFDIIPTFFTVASLYFAKKKLFISALMLGLGGAFKIYPLFLLIPLMSFTSSWVMRLKIAAIGVSVYIITILPFIFSSGFRQTALLAGQTLKSFYAQIPVSGGESIILFLAAIAFLYLIFLSKKTILGNLWTRYFLILIVFFIFTHFHLQYFLWITPFLLIDIIKRGWVSLPAILLIFISFIGMIFFFDQGLSVGLFAPINPSLYQGVTIWQLLAINPDINFSRSILQTLFSGALLFYMYLYFPKEEA